MPMSLRLLYESSKSFLDDQWKNTIDMAEDLYGTFTDERYWYGDYSEDKLEKFNALYSIPGFREMMDYQLDKVNDENYMKKNQLTIADIGDPRKLSATSSAARLNGYVLNRVSSNINRLYR